MELLEALRTRRSTRAFEPTTVPRSVVARILAEASQAPSGSNMQPWIVRAIAGEPRDALCRAATAAFDAGEADEAEWSYYPKPIEEPYLSRRRANGWGLYAHLGIQKGDRAASARQEKRNFDLFGAPVGLFFFVDRHLARGSWIDCGMYAANVMLLAREHGLHTCAQASWLHRQKLVCAQLGVPANEMLLFGMALGYASAAATVNGYHTDRIDPDQFTHWAGFQQDGAPV